ncbi:hypothetical protein BWI15_27415 [Kribbella sp. ALI-6-A]|nr:hypothetical protein BWI15_27415 [Kribbella sp. ALI-6-A]
MDQEAVLENSRELPEDSAVYVWQPARGGGALITSENGSVLFANSGVPFERHLEAFRAGRRTDPVEFES